ncbi:MAG: winged helix DNA-binding domain-containing protein [Actinobacteria bacterium]|nr:winged helix DNA-binding domain-containing protein [Actinomycetota bacterium]
MREWTWEQVRARRLACSHLVERAPADRLVEVVRDVCGIHAQVMGSAELQLAARVDGITQADVREALWERRELVKAWTLRGTLHIHPADELRLWTAASRAVVGAADYEADSLENVDAVVEAIGEALLGTSLLREELADAVAARVGKGPREQMASGWGFFLSDAAFADRLCFGPPQGQKVTFVHPDDWLGPQRLWEPQKALREVARRYAETYGPVGYRQFREWFTSRSLTAAAARELFSELEQPEPEPLPPAPRSVRLLPEYDPFVMGFREREHLVPPAVREQVAAHGKGRYEGPAGTPFLLIDGVCAGIWSRKKTARRIELVVQPARKLTRAVRTGVEAEAEHIGAFLALEPQVTIG